MFNRTVSIGFLGRDVELSYLPSGGAVAKTSTGMNRRFKKQDGSQAEEVCFIDITFFGRTAEIANQYLKRGSKVLVEGRLKLDQWTDQQGVKRSKHSITVETLQMLDGRDGSSNEGNGGQGSYQAPRTSQPRQSQGQQQSNQPEYSGHDIPDLDINDDEIPF